MMLKWNFVDIHLSPVIQCITAQISWRAGSVDPLLGPVSLLSSWLPLDIGEVEPQEAIDHGKDYLARDSWVESLTQVVTCPCRIFFGGVKVLLPPFHMPTLVIANLPDSPYKSFFWGRGRRLLERRDLCFRFSVIVDRRIAGSSHNCPCHLSS